MAGIRIRTVKGICHRLYQWQRHHSVQPLPNQRVCQAFEISEDLDRYDEFYSLDMFGESTEGHKRMPPYVPFAKRKVIVNMNILMFKMNILYPLTEDTTNKKSDQECKHHLRW